jgi:Protein of unknown function (DUF2786)
MNRDQALSKIKKCLALAKSSNPNEAATAMRQAQKLMAEHNVTETDVSLSDVSEQAAPTQLNASTPWEAFLSQMVAESFGCKVFRRHRRMLSQSLSVVKKCDFIFVGVGAAPEVASYAYNVLSRQCARDRLERIRKQPKACKPITKTARGDQFALGWVLAVEKMLVNFAGNARDAKLIEQYFSTNYPNMGESKLKDRTKGRNVSHNDWAQGRAAGSQAQLNRGVGGVQQQGLLK